VTQPGAGSLSVGATALRLKEVKPLLASDWARLLARLPVGTGNPE
jgi:hypothetical protein